MRINNPDWENTVDRALKAGYSSPVQIYSVTRVPEDWIRERISELVSEKKAYKVALGDDYSLTPEYSKAVRKYVDES